MEQDTTRPPDLPRPLRAAAARLRHLPGAGYVEKAAGGALDAIGAVSPRGRRVAVYAGAGVLGVAGVVEWPVAVTGAAVAWLTQPRPAQRPGGEPGAESPDGAGRHLPAAQEDAAGHPGTPAGNGPPAGRPEPTGPGDRLIPSRHRNGHEQHAVREQPAKVGDTATASALKQVAEATSHHAPHGGPHPDPDAAPGQPRDARHTG